MSPQTASVATGTEQHVNFYIEIDLKKGMKLLN